jgi:hypothetical protein
MATNFIHGGMKMQETNNAKWYDSLSPSELWLVKKMLGWLFECKQYGIRAKQKQIEYCVKQWLKCKSADSSDVSFANGIKPEDFGKYYMLTKTNK